MLRMAVKLPVSFQPSGIETGFMAALPNVCYNITGCPPPNLAAGEFATQTSLSLRVGSFIAYGVIV